MQPPQYDLRCPAPKDNTIMHAAAAPSNLDEAITMRSARTELENKIELGGTGSEIEAPKPDLDAKAKNHDFEALLILKFKRKITASNLRKSRDKSLSQPWCRHSNTIYDVQLQKMIILRTQPRHQETLTQPS